MKAWSPSATNGDAMVRLTRALQSLNAEFPMLLALGATTLWRESQPLNVFAPMEAMLALRVADGMAVSWKALVPRVERDGAYNGDARLVQPWKAWLAIVEALGKFSDSERRLEHP